MRDSSVDNCLKTMLVPFGLKEYRLDEKKIKVQLYEMPGTLRDAMIHDVFIQEASIILFLTDPARSESLSSLRAWLEVCKETATTPFHGYILTYSKPEAPIDLTTERIMREAADKYNVSFHKLDWLDQGSCEEFMQACLKVMKESIKLGYYLFEKDFDMDKLHFFNPKMMKAMNGFEQIEYKYKFSDMRSFAFPRKDSFKLETDDTNFNKSVYDPFGPDFELFSVYNGWQKVNESHLSSDQSEEPLEAIEETPMVRAATHNADIVEKEDEEDQSEVVAEYREYKDFKEPKVVKEETSSTSTSAGSNKPKILHLNQSLKNIQETSEKLKPLAEKYANKKKIGVTSLKTFDPTQLFKKMKIASGNRTYRKIKLDQGLNSSGNQFNKTLSNKTLEISSPRNISRRKPTSKGYRFSANSKGNTTRSGEKSLELSPSSVVSHRKFTQDLNFIRENASKIAPKKKVPDVTGMSNTRRYITGTTSVSSPESTILSKANLTSVNPSNTLSPTIQITASSSYSTANLHSYSSTSRGNGSTTSTGPSSTRSRQSKLSTKGQLSPSANPSSLQISSPRLLKKETTSPDRRGMIASAATGGSNMSSSHEIIPTFSKKKVSKLRQSGSKKKVPQVDLRSIKKKLYGQNAINSHTNSSKVLFSAREDSLNHYPSEKSLTTSSSTHRLHHHHSHTNNATPSSRKGPKSTTLMLNNSKDFWAPPTYLFAGKGGGTPSMVNSKLFGRIAENGRYHPVGKGGKGNGEGEKKQRGNGTVSGAGGRLSRTKNGYGGAGTSVGNTGGSGATASSFTMSRTLRKKKTLGERKENNLFSSSTDYKRQNLSGHETSTHRKSNLMRELNFLSPSMRIKNSRLL
eukprot:CAMPEP_0114998576 /NCGR_PEP_ID=MMETSP0216-20121206/15596_1 /TAXON_ID=223996 /ORGANISM="Protocruzia adherens, Strain Boccale" /LENGTH=857 /DNA_ID=CAMNT_0002363213 /DNA_START=44 /DNA_END=2617 /DNA_ORIENTATION=-